MKLNEFLEKENWLTQRVPERNTGKPFPGAKTEQEIHQMFHMFSLEADCLNGWLYAWKNGELCMYMLGAMREFAQQRDPMPSLKGSQQDNLNIQFEYDSYRRQFGDDKMMRWVSCVNDITPPDFVRALADLIWEKDNNFQVMSDGMRAWNEYVRNGRQQEWLAVGAMWNLLSGQRHNPPTMNNYRSCYQADRHRLFKLVHDLVGDP